MKSLFRYILPTVLLLNLSDTSDASRNDFVYDKEHPYIMFGNDTEVQHSMEEMMYRQQETLRTANVRRYEFNLFTGIARLISTDGTTLERRNFDVSQVAFYNIDQHGENYPWASPYIYCIANPVKYIDPDGKDVYRYNDQTGEMVLEKKTNDSFDQIGKFKTIRNRKTGEKTYDLITRKDGTAKTRINNIEKGILSNGMNFKDDNNIIDVGGEGQASVVGVESFLLNFSNLINRELGGYYLSEKNSNDISYIYIGKFKNNTAQMVRSNFDLYRTRSDLYNNVDIKVDYHTHLSKFSDVERLTPSSVGIDGGDMKHKIRQMNIMPTLEFKIITNPQPFYY